MSIAGGVERALERGHRIGCTTIQLFTKNSNQWAAPPLSGESIRLFRQRRRETGIAPLVAHTSYLINLASANAALWEQSIEAYRVEVERCAALGIGLLVLHPGAPKDAGPSFGIERVAEALNRVHAATPGRRVITCLETTAGQGSHLGRTFEELAAIMRLVRSISRIGACFDTCHVFAAGYDIRTPTGYRTTLQAFDRTIGLARLRVIHVNDSQGAFGSRRDRHAHIGQGGIGVEGFRALMRDPRLRAVPKILETPKGPDLEEDRANMTILRSLATNKAG